MVAVERVVHRARTPRQINKQYGAFCETLLHVAAKWGREDLADLLIAAGADR
jgi:hypothetical protein